MKMPGSNNRNLQRATALALIAQHEDKALLRPGTARYKIGAPPHLERQEWTTHAGAAFDFLIKVVLGAVVVGSLWVAVVCFLLFGGVKVGQ